MPPQGPFGSQSQLGGDPGLSGAGSVGPGGGIVPGSQATSPAGLPLTPGSSPTLYDPLNPQPYQPFAPTQVANPSAVPVLPQEQPIQNLGMVSHTGAVAYGLDQMLRGYMQGKSFAQARSAMQLQQQQQGVSQLVNQASQRYLQLVQSGADPNDIAAAKQQVDAAWAAQTDLWKNHIQGMKLDDNGNPVPNTKKNLLQRLTDTSNPNDIAPAAYEAMTKFGPPVYHQAAPYQTPQYQAQVAQAREMRGTQIGTAATQAQTAQMQAQNQQEVQQLLSKPSLTDEERQRLYTLQSGIAMSTGKNSGQFLDLKPVAGSIPKQNAQGQWVQTMTNGRGMFMDQAMPPGFVPNANALKGLTKYDMQNGVWNEYQVDANGQELPGSRRPLSMAAASPGMVTETSHEVAGPLGTETLHNTTIRRPVGTGMSGAGGAGGGNFAPISSAISSAEGYGTAGTIPTRANNPGSLELGDVGHGIMRGANGQSITVFRTPEEGQAALDKQLGTIFSGQDPKYPPTMTLDQFGQKYSGGDTGYGAKIAASLGVSPSTTLGQLAQQQGGASGAGAGTGTTLTPPSPSLAGQFPGGSVPRMYAAPLSKAQNVLADASKAATIANSPDTATNGTAQYLLLTSLFHSAQGRSPNMTELTKIMGTAGWGASLEGWADKLKDGTMSPELFSRIVRFANTNQQAAGKELNDLVTQARGATKGGGANPVSTTTPPPPPPPPAAGGFKWTDSTYFTPAAVQ